MISMKGVINFAFSLMPTSYQKVLNQQSEIFSFMLSFLQSLSLLTSNSICLPSWLFRYSIILQHCIVSQHQPNIYSLHLYLVLLIILFTRYADLFSLLFILMQREIPNVSILRYQLKLHSMQLNMFYKLGYLQEGITHEMNCVLNSTGNFHINRKWDSLRKFRKHRIPDLCL